MRERPPFLLFLADFFWRRRLERRPPIRGWVSAGGAGAGSVEVAGAGSVEVAVLVAVLVAALVEFDATVCSEPSASAAAANSLTCFTCAGSTAAAWSTPAAAFAASAASSSGVAPPLIILLLLFLRLTLRLTIFLIVSYTYSQYFILPIHFSTPASF